MEATLFDMNRKLIVKVLLLNLCVFLTNATDFLGLTFQLFKLVQHLLFLSLYFFFLLGCLLLSLCLNGRQLSVGLLYLNLDFTSLLFYIYRLLLVSFNLFTDFVQ
jgi:hypothetical protein